MASNFNGKVVVVTGGASGIGRSCAELLASCGATVVIADRNIAAARDAAAATGAHAFELDISDTDAVEASAHELQEKFGGVHMLVANAGVIQSRIWGPEKFSMEEWDRIFAIDLRGTFACCASYGSRMATEGGGSIVAIASISGMRSSPLHAYSVAKAAVLQMTSNLAVEWGRSGVRVNSVSPGYTLTPVIRQTIASGLRDPSRMNGMSALGRMVEPSEVAAAVAFLLGDEASAITGVNLPVDAGWLAATSWHTYEGVPPARGGH